MQPLSVSALNQQIKALLEATFEYVLVEGEVSNLTYHTSGHVYFSIKDDRSSVRCVLFRGNARRVKFRMEEGQKVIVEGGVNVYPPRGEYQVNCLNVQPSGIGALALAYEQLKKKLQTQGCFDPQAKKPLPRLPQHIVIITSPTGAAIQDMLRVAHRRWPLLKITLIPTLVQGDGAAPQIAAHIHQADTMSADVIVIGRGGGSLEDLWAFNEEMVAEAVFAANTPIVSAVGHEVDTVISDFVADLRAPTPSAAMEMILPDRDEMLLALDGVVEDFEQALLRHFRQCEMQVESLQDSYRHYSIDRKMQSHQNEMNRLAQMLNERFAYRLSQAERLIPEMRERLDVVMRGALQTKMQKLHSLQQTLQANDPAKRVKKGYAQVLKENSPAELSELQVGDEFAVQDAQMSLRSVVLEIRPLLTPV